jgi:hypothetical protein
LRLVYFDDLSLVDREHRPVVGERGGSAIVVHGQRGLVVVATHFVADQVLLELGVPREKHPVAPSGDPHFLGGVVHFAVGIILVGWVEVQLALLELAENHIAFLDFEQLVLALQPGVIPLLDQLSHLVIRQLDPEIQVSEKAFVVVVALFLSIVYREVIERVVVNLPHVFNPLVDSVLAALQMGIDEREGGVFVAEPDGHRALVARHARETCFDFDLAQALQLVLVLFLGEHDDEAADHDLLDDGDVLDSL